MKKMIIAAICAVAITSGAQAHGHNNWCQHCYNPVTIEHRSSDYVIPLVVVGAFVFVATTMILVGSANHRDTMYFDSY